MSWMVQKIGWLKLSISKLPDEAQVLMDFLGLTDHELWIVDRLFPILVSPACVESWEVHVSSRPCGCFQWLRHSKTWKAL